MKPKYIKNFFPNLFSWEELGYLLNIRPLMNVERVTIYNEKRDKVECSNWENSPWTIDKNCYPPSILKKYIEKYICIFEDMSRCSEKINHLSNLIERKFDMAVDAHIYICKNINAIHPFGVHTDRSSNLIVQCEGKTNFKVWDFEQNLIVDCAMIPGDAIFIPASFPHEAITITPRMSVSFPLHTDKMATFEDRTWIKL